MRPLPTTRRKEFRRSAFSLIAVAGFFIATMASGQSGDGTWIGTGGSANWSDTAQWAPGPGNYANGVGATAFLNATNLTTDQTITLDLNVTLGILNIGDTDGTHKYSIVAGGGTL